MADHWRLFRQSTGMKKSDLIAPTDPNLGGRTTPPVCVDILENQTCEGLNRMNVREALEGIDTSLTIDELTDRIVRLHPDLSDRDNLTGWADVHELLYYVVLPEFHEDGSVTFNPNSGLVTPPKDNTKRYKLDSATRLLSIVIVVLTLLLLVPWVVLPL